MAIRSWWIHGNIWTDLMHRPFYRFPSLSPRPVKYSRVVNRFHSSWPSQETTSKQNDICVKRKGNNGGKMPGLLVSGVFKGYQLNCLVISSNNCFQLVCMSLSVQVRAWRRGNPNHLWQQFISSNLSLANKKTKWKTHCYIYISLTNKRQKSS